MKNIRFKRFIVGCIVLFIGVSSARSQAIWELGLKGGTDFYLGDVNSTIFNAIQPVYGIYGRYNVNYRWVTKTQFMMGNINVPFKQRYMDISVQQEFNFFEFGKLNDRDWTRWFSPYICGGIGLSTFDNYRGKLVYSGSIPFGLGVKLKVLKKLNVSLEWTMHKLFSDEFDFVNNPYKQKSAWLTNKDWYSMATLMIGIDLGNRNKYCK